MIGHLAARLTRKSRSNFYYAFFALPKPRRDALYAVYAFCRIVDDAVDLGQDRTAQRAELARWRDEIARVYEGRAEHPAGQRLQVALRRFPIPPAIRTPLPPDSSTSTARAPLASSTRSPLLSAARAAACASPPTARCARACSA